MIAYGRSPEGVRVAGKFSDERTFILTLPASTIRLIDSASTLRLFPRCKTRRFQGIARPGPRHVACKVVAANVSSLLAYPIVRRERRRHEPSPCAPREVPRGSGAPHGTVNGNDSACAADGTAALSTVISVFLTHGARSRGSDALHAARAHAGRPCRPHGTGFAGARRVLPGP